MAPNSREYRRQIIHQVGSYGTLGLNLVLSTCIGLAGGYYLDRWLGTRPVLTLVFLLLGIAAGFINLFRTMKEISQRNEQ